MVIHDLNLASRYADRILMLDEGTIFVAGTAEEAFTEQNIRQVYGVESNIHYHNGILSVTPVCRVKTEVLSVAQDFQPIRLG